MGGSAGRAHMINHEVREQPHFVLGPKSFCHEGGPCGAKRGAPFAATRERPFTSRRPLRGGQPCRVAATSDSRVTRQTVKRRA